MQAGDLAALREVLGACRRCPLADTRTTLVFGVGDPHARLMFIGEAPGKNEDLQGEPFVGAAGKLLDELLQSIGMTRGDVYIANILKCRPPNNRNPEADEIATCTPFLDEQIRLIAPDVIATLGNFATRYVLRTERSITGLRGRLFIVGGHKVIPIYHPAAALYDKSKLEVLFDDFKRLRAVLDRGVPDGPQATAGIEVATKDEDRGDPGATAGAPGAVSEGTPDGPIQTTLF